MGWFSNKIKGNGDESIKRAIGVAYAREGEMLPTKIPWYEAEKFILRRGKEVNIFEDGGVSASVQMLVNGDKVFVAFSKNRLNGTILISANNENKLMMEHDEEMKRLGIDI